MMIRCRHLLLALVLACTSLLAIGQKPTEVHNEIAPQPGASKRLALRLDACSGKFDDELIEFLIRNRIPATIFATKKWLDRNPVGVSVIKAHHDLFDVEDHGENHVPAVIGVGRKVYGIPGEPDVMHLRREVTEGAKAIEEIGKLGYRIAGFSVNADAGATLKRSAIEERLKHVRSGDVIIAHMNKPASDSAEGLSVALMALIQAGYTFVRLDQVDLREIPEDKERQRP